MYTYTLLSDRHHEMSAAELDEAVQNAETERQNAVHYNFDEEVDYWDRKAHELRHLRSEKFD
jgi:hypothetical protein